MDTTSSNRRLIAEIDCGCLPAGVLVVRESRWQRIIGAMAGFFMGILTAWVATMLALHYGEFGLALLVSVVAVVGLSGGVWLLYELLNATYYYMALDDKYFYRRRGPRGLTTLALEELGEFEVSKTTLWVLHRPSNQRIVVLKNAYAPEEVCKLARRITLWRLAPRDEWESSLTQLNYLETAAARSDANQRIAGGLGLLCLFPLLIILSTYLRLFQVPALSIALWCFYTFVGVQIFLGGIVRRIRVVMTQQPTQVAQQKNSGQGERERFDHC